MADTGGGDEEIAFLELFNPRYDEGTRAATYDVTILEDASRVDMRFAWEADTGADIGATYGAAYLFIDSCLDRDVICLGKAPSMEVGDLGTQRFCWDWDVFVCVMCQDYAGQCNRTFPACNTILS